MCCVIGGTIAWLTARSDTITNTFSTVGDINIKLDEALVDEDGHVITGDNARRVTSNTYKLYPGGVLDKDPTVTVLAGSEECYVFVCVENKVLLDSGIPVASLNIDNGNWIMVQTSGTKTLYKYVNTVKADSADEVLPPVFTTLTISGQEVTSENIDQLRDDVILVNAFAFQSSNVDYSVALNAALANFGF